MHYLSRRAGTSRNGGSFSEQTVQAVWNKGRIEWGKDPALWRKDACGTWMYRQAYGNTNSPNGWEIDHSVPVARGGTDDLSNLQPLQWENNRYKGDNYPNWSCKIHV